MKYGFIGCGNMGGAIARALARVTRDFMLTDRSGKVRSLAQELGGAYGTNAEAAACDRAFLGVKPQMRAGVLGELQPILAEKKPLLITMAAGLEIRKIEEMAGIRLPVIRIMPNTPVSAGKGVILYCRNDLVDDATLSQVLSDLRFAGMLDPLDEKLIDDFCIHPDELVGIDDPEDFIQSYIDDMYDAYRREGLLEEQSFPGMTM